MFIEFSSHFRPRAERAGYGPNFSTINILVLRTFRAALPPPLAESLRLSEWLGFDLRLCLPIAGEAKPRIIQKRSLRKARGFQQGKAPEPRELISDKPHNGVAASWAHGCISKLTSY